MVVSPLIGCVILGLWLIAGMLVFMKSTKEYFKTIEGQLQPNPWVIVWCFLAMWFGPISFILWWMWKNP